MADWDAAQYLKFADERTRPAADLLARVPLAAPARVVDLGCGPGNSTELLVARYPEAAILGLDTSPGMLAEARRRLPGVAFEQADVASLNPEPPPDLLFANAVLQWLPHHASLLPRLARSLAPGGCLAVQMPDNLEEPSHRLMRRVAGEPPFAARLAAAAASRTRIASFSEYDAWLTAAGCTVDIWRTTYVHALAGHRGIVEWVRGTGLRPFLDPLDAEAQAEFLARYEAALAEAYPPQADGRVLLPFPRLFLVARRTR
ncbi:trans-aconitate 2-methyltransferase [Methylobacterium nodulans]|uniref:Trans-aconitate 2-methyltransferase n=1 Tax=Methylobacterium nodulans (strain LMG 21967 / CNCM I-2342 / ORS 2060) TaxID=460265 RepID=TAM_METNO|nr:trans-aconitate 2-methyltransferase [Methylobacterium nodulans]B8ISV4.1 RecName: Full=Trans-aconitate 2-methyltransferase [Methylobacterium nodulans ORS 2060]ACL60753.1 Methyltransferase type 11 [Methylobacterium nodulans ORS 2060]